MRSIPDVYQAVKDWFYEKAHGPTTRQYGEYVGVTSKATSKELLGTMEDEFWRSIKRNIITTAFKRSKWGVFNQNQLYLPGSLRVLYKRPTGLANPINMYSTIAWKYHSIYLPYTREEQRYDAITRALKEIEPDFRKRFRAALLMETK
ncbi:MAG: hypothetical protein ACYS7Y_36235 [Planctomycetota bacterium]|jgi:hypothetical protein